jgi:hypothetical protein
MTLRSLVAIYFVAAILPIAGCQEAASDRFSALSDQNKTLQAKLDDAQRRLAAIEARLARSPDPVEVAQMQARIVELEHQLKKTQAAAQADSGRVPPRTLSRENDEGKRISTGFAVHYEFLDFGNSIPPAGEVHDLSTPTEYEPPEFFIRRWDPLLTWHAGDLIDEHPRLRP